ncbi:MAG TPA: hypothetical protein VH560_05390 [Polyangia bacterium]|nr:hypothetical protein [Polyangia bacterium]
MERWNRSFVAPIFVLTAALRLTLGIVNRWWNDYHMRIVYKILLTHRIPVANECWECHHPKAFYLTTAGIVKLLSLPFGNPATIAGQLLNVFVSLAGLLVFAQFLTSLEISHRTRNLVFLTVALNTCWGAISAQATTDSFAITFGMMAFVASYRFFVAPSGPRLFLCALFCALGAVSKFSGVLVLLLTIFNVALSFLSDRRVAARNALCSRWILGVILLLAPLPWLGGYVSAARITGDPLTMGVPKYEVPSFFAKTTRNRPGIQSIWSGYFTFDLVDVLEHPYTSNGQAPEPAHRTSFWSQLYGRAFYTRFESWPAQWHVQNRLVDDVGRAELLLGLSVVLVTLIGAASAAGATLRRLPTILSRPLEAREYLRVISLTSAGAFLMSLFRVTATLRDFAAIKPMYLLPALFGFAVLYLEGWQTIEGRWQRSCGVLATLVIALMLFQVVDLAWLVSDLTRIHEPALIEL